MAHFDSSRRKFMITTAVAGAALWVPRMAVAADPIAVVMRHSSRLTSLDATELRRIFLGRGTSCPDGGEFIPLNLDRSSSLRIRFDRAVLGYEPDEVERYWTDQRIRGKKAPRTIDARMLKTLLEKVSGTISYTFVSMAGSLKVIAINGKLPGDSGYVLG